LIFRVLDMLLVGWGPTWWRSAVYCVATAAIDVCKQTRYTRACPASSSSPPPHMPVGGVERREAGDCVRDYGRRCQGRMCWENSTWLLSVTFAAECIDCWGDVGARGRCPVRACARNEHMYSYTYTAYIHVGARITCAEGGG
jgi:hypothetical protein